MLKKEQTLLYYVKSEFKNRILFIHVNQIAVQENHDKIVKFENSTCERILIG